MITIVLGRREVGKSTLAYHLVRSSRPAVVLDPRLMFATDDPIGDLPDDLDGLDDALGPQSIAIIQPNDDLAGTTRELAVWIRDWCRDHPGRETLSILLDECALLDLATPEWDWVFRCAPRDRVAIVLTAHRPRDLSTNIRAIADYWCIFRTTQEHDLKVIEERCGVDFVEDVRDLSPREFMVWDDTRAVKTRRDNPAAWFVPIRVPDPSSSRFENVG